MKNEQKNLIILLAVLIGALSAWMYQIALTNDSPISDNPAPLETSAQESDAVLPRTLDVESQIEHDNSTSEPVAADTQEPDIALPRATNVKGQIEQIKSGDFSNVTELPDDISEWFKRIYPESDTESGWLEWVECDLNENGLKGLIWQEKDSSPLKIKRIEAVFAIKDNEARLVLSTYGRQGTDLFFMAKNGNIINRYGHYGTEDYDHYTHYVFHDDWSTGQADDLTVVRIYDWAIEELKEDGLLDKRVQDAPYWAKAGVYYFTNGRDDELDEPQFIKAYEEMTGYSFYGDNPLKPDWAN